MAVSMEAAEKDAAIVQGHGRSSDTVISADCQVITRATGKHSTTRGETANTAHGMYRKYNARARAVQDGDGRPAARATAASAAGERAQRQRECRACGGAHSEVACKFTRYVCRVCNRQGHLKRMCPALATSEQHCVVANEIEEKRERWNDDEDEFQIL
ncbi:unnamed protein product, partial [Brenthis ino]